MKRKQFLFVILLFSFFIHACTVNNVTIDEKIGKQFENNAVKGTFGMFDNSRGIFTIYDLDRFKKSYSPAETFNIFNTLVGMHIGRIADENALISAKDTAGSEKSLTITEAFKASSTAHFRALARSIGKDTMKAWVDSVKYGNKMIGNAVDSFWTNGKITITPDEQLGMMKRLYFKQLPFRASVQEAMKKMMVVENNSQYQLAYQFGFTQQQGKKVTWVVGWMEENMHVYPFVINFEGAQDPLKTGKALTHYILTYIGFFKGRM